MKDNAKVVPLIALRGLVVFPNTTITVDVGRPKSVRALEEALRRDGKLFFAAQKELINIDPSKEEIFDVGTVCDVLQKIDLPNNNVRLLIKGQYKAKVVEYLKENDYFSVAVEELENKNSDTIVTQALLRQARELLATLCVNVPNKINKELLTKLADTYEPNQYADLICHLIIYQDKLKQKLLEIDDTQVRLEELCKIIASETEIAKVEKKISAQVKQSIDKGQKEYYLKEQMKAISHELGEDADEIAQYEKKIRSAKMPAEVEEKALKELKRLEKMAPTSPDATVSRSYIEWLTDLAWDFQTEDNKDLERAKKILDEDHFGLDKIKERILEYLAVMQLTGTLNGPILCFVGPPGVGKTSIAKSIARCLDRVFERMSLGGVRDEAEIRGHRRTYIGAIPGKIIYLMKQAGCKNPVLLLDEIDKMSSDMRGDPASAMLEVLDPEQNNTFTDHYLEAPYDLSKVLFIATANKVDTIPAPLLDRMEIIELTGYTEEEKMEIAKKFLIGKAGEAARHTCGRAEHYGRRVAQNNPSLHERVGRAHAGKRDSEDLPQNGFANR
ncbi:MAG: LON peptidase substrate-binding domain-containing protein [Lachnospiraceae bacterium]